MFHILHREFNFWNTTFKYVFPNELSEVQLHGYVYHSNNMVGDREKQVVENTSMYDIK